MNTRYEIRHLQNMVDEVGEVEGFCYADGYSLWDRQGEGLVLQFHTDDTGQLHVDADWPRQWDKEKSSAEAIEWAIQHDVFSTTENMDDDYAYICEVGKESIL